MMVQSPSRSPMAMVICHTSTARITNTVVGRSRRGGSSSCRSWSTQAAMSCSDKKAAMSSRNWPCHSDRPASGSSAIAFAMSRSVQVELKVRITLTTSTSGSSTPNNPCASGTAARACRKARKCRSVAAGADQGRQHRAITLYVGSALIRPAKTKRVENHRQQVQPRTDR